MEQLLPICKRRKKIYDAHMAINKNKLIEARGKEKFTNRNKIKAFLLEPLSVEFNVLHSRSRLLSLWHIFTSCKTSAGFFFSSAFVQKGRENCFGWATTFIECNDVRWVFCCFQSSRLWEKLVPR